MFSNSLLAICISMPNQRNFHMCLRKELSVMIAAHQGHMLYHTNHMLYHTKRGTSIFFVAPHATNVYKWPLTLDDLYSSQS